MGTELEEKIKTSLENGRLPCPAAFRISRELKVSLKEVGETCNRLNIKVCHCQLGCFP